MLNVQNLYGTPQIPRKRPCVRPRRMTLIDLRSARAESEDELRYRKSATGTTKAEVGSSQFYSKHGILPIYDSTDSLDSRHSVTTMRFRHRSSVFDGTTRFPKLTECAHFHYDFVELSPILVCCLSGELSEEGYRHNEEGEIVEQQFTLRVTSGERVWSIRRTYENFRQFDRQLHKCIYDRKFSHLPELQREWAQTDNNGEFLQGLLCRYMERFSLIAGSMINCGPILNWLELDNRGNRLLAVDDSGINTPAIAAAHAVKRYTAQAADEISLEVGDIVSVIDMPPAEDTIWWRGKRGFEVGFFPSECVEVIGDKVPQSMASRIPDPPQKAVLRKHGKLITFFRTFFSNRPSRNELKQSGIVKERVFGCDLGEHLLNSGHDVPLVLKCCSDVIQNHGIVDGIYRLSGIASNIQKLRLAFDEDRAPDLMSENYLQDIHSISSLLKMYFRELPNPLLTYQLYDKFAEAVRDEDNKLLKIHDVVQQLPPPHYRTTEYLMRHLARVAAHGLDTGMHSKNLAIVWAPNLLRSKELEMGGGAAALQGVGIQAVVTEFLICYADLIFSDKIPAYSSPDSNRSQKKPRPKSLAISTPTRLLSLEEARERALTTSIAPQQKFIEVGGGPETLPDKYHTVLDLPGYKKKAKDPKEPVKQKKSPVTGWKSFFSKSRSSSMKVGKGRKSSVPDPLALGEQKAITEEDVHNWKRRRLRTAKSVESLLTGRGSRFYEFGSFDSSMTSQSESQNLPRKRGSSSSSRSRSQSLDRNMFGSSSSRETVKEMAIDIGSLSKRGSIKSEHGGPDKENASPGECKLEKKQQSFIRGDQTRRAIAHRKTASAPANQLHLETSPPLPEKRRDSQQSNDTPSMRKKKHEKGKVGLENPEISNPSGEVTISREMSDKFVFRVDSTEIFQPQEQMVKTGDAKTSSKGDKSGKGTKSKKKGKSAKEEEIVCTVELRESPSVRRKYSEESMESVPARRDQGMESVPARRDQGMETEPTGRPSEANQKNASQTYYSPHHDYAEILEDEEEIREHENRIKRDMEKVSKARENLSDTKTPEGFGKRTQKQHKDMHNLAQHEDYVRRTGERSPSELRPSDSLMSEVEKFEQSIHERPNEYDNPRMSKSLSIPSDIQRSVDNVNLDSQSDLMSSVTISELSRSVDSFNMGLDEAGGERALWRSSSLDGEQDSPLGRTLREINAQIDKAFKRDPSTPNEQLYMYPVEESLRFSISEAPTLDTTTFLPQSLYGDYEEDVATPTNEVQFEFDSLPGSSYSTVPTATLSLRQDSFVTPQYTSVESLSVPVHPPLAHETTLHISEPELNVGDQELRQTVLAKPCVTVESPSHSVLDANLKYDVVRAPLRSPKKETSQSLESRKQEMDLEFSEIHPSMRESQLTEGEYVQLEDDDYVRLQADAQLTDSVCVIRSPTETGERTPTASDSAPIHGDENNSASVSLNINRAEQQAVDLSLPLSASDENFWQNTEFPGLSPLSDVIEAYCCNLESGEETECVQHDQSSPDKCRHSHGPGCKHSHIHTSEQSMPEPTVKLNLPDSTDTTESEHSERSLTPADSGEVTSEGSTGDPDLLGDVEVSYQIDFRKSGGFDILTDSDVPQSSAPVQEISTECFICTNDEEGGESVTSTEEELTSTQDLRWTGHSSLEVVEEREQIKKGKSDVPSTGSKDDLKGSAPMPPALKADQSASAEEWYAEMLQHGLGQTPESDFIALEAALSYRCPETTEGSSSKRPYQTMVEEQRYVDSLIAQRAFGMPSPLSDSHTSPVKKLKDGRGDSTGVKEHHGASGIPASSPTQTTTVSPTRKTAVSPTQKTAVSPTQKTAVSPTQNVSVPPTQNETVSAARNTAVRHTPPTGKTSGGIRQGLSLPTQRSDRQTGYSPLQQISPPKHDELIAVRPKLTKVVKEVREELCKPEIISVHELTSAKGQAKLIVERRPIDWKKVQTVHATKVEQPPKQHAESLDSLSSVGSGSWPHELKSSKSHESLRESRSGMADIPLRMTTSACESHEYYGDMGELVLSPDTMSTSLTSSTDTTLSRESDLTLDLPPQGAFLSMTGSGYLGGSCTGSAFSVQKAASMPNVGRWSPPVDSEQSVLQRNSLTSTKAGKLQSLKELFEPSSAENSSSPDLKQEAYLWRSTSRPASSDRQTYPHTRSKSTEHAPRATDGLLREAQSSSFQLGEEVPKWQVSGLYQSQDQNLPPSDERTTHSKTVLQRWQYSEPQSSTGGSGEPGLDFSKRRVRIADPAACMTGKPPVYRSTSVPQSRTHSDSALEDSHVSDAKLSSDEVFTGEISTGSLGRDQSKGSGLQRKGSIRELMAVFEHKDKADCEEDSPEEGERETNTPTPAPSELTSNRDSLEVLFTNVRGFHTQSDTQRGPSPVTDGGVVRPQSMRLGPKPFYGSKS